MLILHLVIIMVYLVLFLKDKTCTFKVFPLHIVDRCRTLEDYQFWL